MSSYDDEVEMWGAIVKNDKPATLDYHAAFITQQLDFILEEVEATRGTTSEHDGVAILAAYQVERGILNESERLEVVALYNSKER